MDTWLESARQKYGNREPFVSARTVAVHLGLSIHAVYKMAQRKQLPSHKIGKSRRFKISEVEAAMG
jgi:excisionase family DNA binding protein